MKIKQILKENSEYKQLANDIDKFIEKYAAISPNYDPEYDNEEDRFTGPDPGQLSMASKLLKIGRKPDRVWSEWNSGCYKPYNDKTGKQLHDSLIKRIKEL